MNRPKKLECFSETSLYSLVKCNTLALQSYEENEVLWIQYQGLYSQHLIFFVAYEWTQ
jgi:hypothetical protein